MNDRKKAVIGWWVNLNKSQRDFLREKYGATDRAIKPADMDDAYDNHRDNLPDPFEEKP